MVLYEAAGCPSLLAAHLDGELALIPSFEVGIAQRLQRRRPTMVYCKTMVQNCAKDVLFVFARLYPCNLAS